MSTVFQAKLEQGIERLGLSLSKDAVGKLLSYHALLVKWNKAYNLTSVRDPSEMIDRHLIDSLSILPFVEQTNLLDVGTGPGLPGMVIALVMPELPVSMLDSNGKKTRFLNQVKMDLRVDNATIVHHRLETWQTDDKFAQITSRAFATLSDMVGFARHLLAPSGRFVAMKGLYPSGELAELPDDVRVERVLPLQVPGTEGERHLVELSLRAQATQ